jgi:hypothetical protein
MIIFLRLGNVAYYSHTNTIQNACQVPRPRARGHPKSHPNSLARDSPPFTFLRQIGIHMTLKDDHEPSSDLQDLPLGALPKLL